MLSCILTAHSPPSFDQEYLLIGDIGSSSL